MYNSLTITSSLLIPTDHNNTTTLQSVIILLMYDMEIANILTVAKEMNIQRNRTFITVDATEGY